LKRKDKDINSINKKLINKINYLNSSLNIIDLFLLFNKVILILFIKLSSLITFILKYLSSL